MSQVTWLLWIHWNKSFHTINWWSKWYWLCRSYFSCELIIRVNIKIKWSRPNFLIFWCFLVCSKWFWCSNWYIKRTIFKGNFNLVWISDFIVWRCFSCLLERKKFEIHLIRIRAHYFEWSTFCCMYCHIISFHCWIISGDFNFKIDWVFGMRHF